jgi:hypothetical protein
MEPGYESVKYSGRLQLIRDMRTIVNQYANFSEEAHEEASDKYPPGAIVAEVEQE